DCAEFIDATESAVRLTGAKLCSNAPDIDFRAALFQVRDHVLVEIARADDLCICEPCLIQHLARFDAQRGAVAGIQTHADHVVPLSAQFATYLDGVTYAVD